MTEQLFAIAALWVMILAYAVFATIDFGSGFLYLYAHVRGRAHEVVDVIDRFQSPMWELANVFLVFVLVGLVGFFPSAALFYGTSMLLPGSIALILIVLRGSFVVYQHYFDGHSPIFPAIYGISGLLAPAALVTVLPISEGGFVTYQSGIVTAHERLLFSSPMEWAFIYLALVSVGYFSTIFMSHYAKQAGALSAERFFRGIALFTGPPAIIGALLVAYTLHQEALWHYVALMRYWPVFGISLALFFAAGRLVYDRRYGWAFIAAVVQYALAVGIFGWTHLPYLLYPYLTLQNGFTDHAMFVDLAIVLAFGVVLLIPGFIIFYKLFVGKRASH